MHPDSIAAKDQQDYEEGLAVKASNGDKAAAKALHESLANTLKAEGGAREVAALMILLASAGVFKHRQR